MSPLFHAHSGIRYLLLLAGVVAVIACAVGHAQRKPLTKLARISCSVFIGLMHLQVLVGIGVVVTGAWYARLTGHLVPMLVASVLAQVLVVKNKKSAAPAHLLPLIGVGGALLLIVVGIYAIGRTPFGTVLGSQRVG